MTPLKGIKVVELAFNLPGPLTTLMLSDLGAEVIKVEPPTGDPLRHLPPIFSGASAPFHCLNRGKRFVSLDLQNPSDRDRLLQLLAQADIFLEGFRPDVLPRLGLGAETLFLQKSDLIVVRMSAYGLSGPYAGRPGHDLNFVALSGILAGHESVNPLPVQVADVGASLLALSAILAALAERQHTPSQPMVLDVPLLDGALFFAMMPHARDASGDQPLPGRGFLEGGLPTYRLYRTCDGRFVSIAALEPRLAAETERAFSTLDDETLGTKISHMPFASFLREYVAPCTEPVLTLAEARAHPAVTSRDLFRTMTCEEGSIQLPVTPFARDKPVPEGPWARPVGADNVYYFETSVSE